jgi:uncharacterized protein
MLIVSDTTTITNLWQVGYLDLLQALYKQVIIPVAVWDELCTISEQKEFLLQKNWLQVESPQNKTLIEKLLYELDLGEAEAIVLSIELNADFLIMDEAMGRRKAEDFKIKVIGLLGILLKAKQENLIAQIKPILDALDQKANFFISPKLYDRVLKLAQE